MWRTFFIFSWLWLGLHVPVGGQTPTGDEKPNAPNWAEEYLSKDPLSAKELVSLDDLKQALADPDWRATVFERHWTRLDGVTDAEKKAFLGELLRESTLEVRNQAASQLGRLGWLEEVVGQLLLDFTRTEDAELREAAIVALKYLDLGKAAELGDYRRLLIENLASATEDVRDAAMMQLEANGYAVVPELLDALRHPNQSVRLNAANVLSRILGSRGRERSPSADSTSGLPGRSDSSAYGVAPSPPKSALAATGMHHPRQLSQAEPQQVRVYFGTNRELIPSHKPAWPAIAWMAGLGLACIFGLAYLWRYPSDKIHINSCSTMLLTILMCLVGGWAIFSFRDQLQDFWKIGTGPRFGPRRDPSQTMHYGYCDVSIPPSHIVGELEAPMIGAEDEEQHVILRHTEAIEEDSFFKLLRTELERLDPVHRGCFVFIHGFNVDFEKAARRTAQIHHDLQFTGLPIFFSWPSRASLHHYFSDRNEIEYSRYVIKQFLLDVADRVKTDRIHVIAHSMGADATCRAIAELGDRGRIFDQIVLAAPDIDREVFRVQLVPRIAKTAVRTTLYCSRSDLALHLSNTFNDAPRAGDSSRGIFVSKEIDTVDASGIDTDLLGHSYYGDCVPILNDVRLLMDQNLPPEQRPLKPWPFQELLKYWTFDLPSLAPPSSIDAKTP